MNALRVAVFDYFYLLSFAQLFVGDIPVKQPGDSAAVADLETFDFLCLIAIGGFNVVSSRRKVNVKQGASSSRINDLFAPLIGDHNFDIAEIVA